MIINQFSQNKMHKRGQLAIFVIIAVLIMAAIGGIVYIENTKKPSESPEIKEVSTYIESCLENMSKAAISAIGRNGGYFVIPEDYNLYLNYPIAYSIDNGKNLAPKKQVLENQISQYIDTNIDVCLNNFNDFKKRGFSISKQNNKITAIIVKDEVDIIANIPVSITKDNSTSFIKDFSAFIKPIRFETLLKANNEIATSETIDPRTMCLTCIRNIAISHDLKVEIIETGNRNEFIFTLIDEKSNFIGEPYGYNFAARYNFPECENVEECFNALR